MKLILVAITIFALTSEGNCNTSKIDKRLLSKDPSAKSNIFITFHNGTDSILKYTSKSRFTGRGAKITALRDNLRDHAAHSQIKVIDYLQRKGQGTKYQSFWISNQVFLKDATMADITALADLKEVKSVRMEEVIVLDAVHSGKIEPRVFPGVQWGIDKIKAPQAISLLKASSVPASTVVVGVIDTGCRHTHETLKDNWVGEYGWFDPQDGNLLPIDPVGHGTHVTGTLCGKGGIGVYPDAKWMACRGCESRSCSQVNLVNCAQFMFCPRMADGSGQDCSKAPVIINNSWGGPGGDTWFDAEIAGWVSAGIIPVFAIGNSGPSCGTAESPGDNIDVVSVGATDINDNIAGFSSVGPTLAGAIKPDVSAPGDNIYSASNLGDDLYRIDHGTSMAAPHVSGLVAILRAYNPNLSNADVRTHLQRGAEKNLPTFGQICGGIADNVFPNNQFGYGRINAFSSLQSLIGATPFKCITAGTYVNAANCRKYYKCIVIKGTLYTYDFTCPTLSYFDSDTKKCILGNCP